MSTDWSYLSYHLATIGIPSMVEEDIATNPEDDPWMPADGADCVLVWMTKADAGLLCGLLVAAKENVLEAALPLPDKETPNG